MHDMTIEKRVFTKNKIKGAKFFMDNNHANIGGKSIPYSVFVKNAYTNADRYIAEIQNRAWSLYGYATNNNLVNVFLTLTLPTEYHKTKTIYNNGKKVKTIKNKRFIDDETHNPKNGSIELSKMLSKIWQDRAWKNIPSDKRVYFRVTEPHKNGTPHIHVSIFIPKENVDSVVSMIERKFPSPQSKIVKEIHNPVAYLMKYVLKTLDDLRGNEDNLTDLTLWYVYHGINRFYTSRTLISLNVFRVLGGRYTLLELTQMEKDKTLTIYIDPNTQKIVNVYDDSMEIYNRKPIGVEYESMLTNTKRTLKKIIKKEHIYTVPDVDNIVVPAYLKDYELYKYYFDLDIEDEDTSLLHYGVTQNEMVRRGLLADMPINSLNDFNMNFGDYNEAF